MATIEVGGVPFSNKDQALLYWANEARARYVGNYDDIEAIKAFRAERVDILLPNNTPSGWKVYTLYPQYRGQRQSVRNLMQDMRKGLFNRSLA